MGHFGSPQFEKVLKWIFKYGMEHVGLLLPAEDEDNWRVMWACKWNFVFCKSLGIYRPALWSLPSKQEKFSWSTRPSPYAQKCLITVSVITVFTLCIWICHLISRMYFIWWSNYLQACPITCRLVQLPAGLSNYLQAYPITCRLIQLPAGLSNYLRAYPITCRLTNYL